MKISKHGKLRLKERANINTNQLAFYKNALRKGKSYGSIKDERIKNYLLSKENTHSKAKLYKGYVFIHSKNSKQLYTMYELPEKYRNEKNN